MTYVAYTNKHAHVGKRNGMFLTLLLGIVGLLPPSASAETQSSIFPITISAIVPCTGDVVVLSGELHELLAFTSNSNGGFHVKDQTNYQGLSGPDLMTGAKYQGSGLIIFPEFNLNVGQQFTLMEDVSLIGQGQAANFVLHITEHITVDANGVFTVFHDGFVFECK